MTERKLYVYLVKNPEGKWEIYDGRLHRQRWLNRWRRELSSYEAATGREAPEWIEVSVSKTRLAEILYHESQINAERADDTPPSPSELEVLRLIAEYEDGFRGT